jgi:hypothetical protein
MLLTASIASGGTAGVIVGDIVMLRER